MSLEIKDGHLPGLYQAADGAAIAAQREYYRCLKTYLASLVIASLAAFFFEFSSIGAIVGAILFLIPLFILIYMGWKRPDSTWYSCRAVAESVRTRAWRWMMRAEPYGDFEKVDIVVRQFVADLKAIFEQNKQVVGLLPVEGYNNVPISEEMEKARALSVEGRFKLYKSNRIEEQATWYSKKAIFNRKWAAGLFWALVVAHAIVVIMMLYRIKDPMVSLPIEVIAISASVMLTWLEAKKHSELASSYSLAAHEISLIKGEALGVDTENALSDFVVNAETAFSREHTQWAARKSK